MPKWLFAQMDGSLPVPGPLGAKTVIEFGLRTWEAIGQLREAGESGGSLAKDVADEASDQ